MCQYKVKKEDLIGELEGFPIEIAQKMVNYQANPDVSVFQKCLDINHTLGGFTWAMSPEGSNFWNDVIINKKFNKFFEKYPFTFTDADIKGCKYHPYIIDLAIQRRLERAGSNRDNPSSALAYILHNPHNTWFCWSATPEGWKFWSMLDFKIQLSNYKPKYYVNKLQREEASGGQDNISGGDRSKSGNTTSCSTILYYGKSSKAVGTSSGVTIIEVPVSSELVQYHSQTRRTWSDFCWH